MALFFRKSFTLVEILIVLFIVGIIVGTLTFILKPQEIFAKLRDTKRISDTKNLNKVILTFRNNDPYFNELNYASSQVVYLSLPDTSSTCGTWFSQLPPLPSGWSYHCSATPTNIDGTGWIPLPFSQNDLVNLSQLPLDPVNKPLYYYAFVVSDSGYEINANLQIQKLSMTNDQGNDPNAYEIGTNKLLISGLYTNQQQIATFLKTIGGTNDDYAYSVQQTSDGGYIVVGYTDSFGAGYYDFFLVKLDSSGNINNCSAVSSVSPTVSSITPTISSVSP